jgi:hypothetical protein
MKEMHIKPLTEEDRKRNEYLDKINREPWPLIFLILIALLSIFTLLVLMGTF